MQAALVGSILANSVLVLGIAFIVGGLRNGPQTFDSDRARMVVDADRARGRDDGDAVARACVPHAGASRTRQALSLICAGVLLALFVLTLPSFLRSAPGEEHEPARWSTPLDRRRPARRRASRPP